MSSQRRRSARLQAVEVARSRLSEEKTVEPFIAPTTKAVKGRRRSEQIRVSNKEAVSPVSPDEGVVSEDKDSSMSPSPAKQELINDPSPVKAPARKSRRNSLGPTSSRLNEEDKETAEDMPKQETKKAVKAPRAPRAPRAPKAAVAPKPPKAPKAPPVRASTRGSRSMAKRVLENEEEIEEKVEVKPIKQTKTVKKRKMDKTEEIGEDEETKEGVKQEAVMMDEVKEEDDINAKEEVNESTEDDDDDDQEMDSSIPFGNDSEDDFVPKKKTIEKKQVSGRKPRASAVKARKGFVTKLNDSQNSLSSSSSSDDDSEISEFNTDVEEEIKKAQEVSDQEISFGNEVDDEEIEELGKATSDQDDDFVPNRRKKAAPSQTRASNRGGASKSGGSKKATTRPKTVSRNSNRNSKSSKAPTGRTHLQRKVAQPWQKNISYDDPRSGRKMSKGERKMLEFRQHSAELACGRLYEMTMEEAVEIVQQFREQARKMRETLVLEGNSEKPEAEANSSSEDEWEEMEAFDDDTNTLRVEVTVQKQQEAEPDWWSFYLRQEVNKCIRETWENTHKAHLLCYMAHLQYIHKTVTVESLIPSLLLTQTTGELRSCAGEPSTLKTIKKVINWYTSTYKPTSTNVEMDQSVFDDLKLYETARYATLVSVQKYETDLDRAALLFGLYCALDFTCRICLNIRPIARSWNLETIEKYIEMKESFDRKSLHATRDIQDYWVEVWESKLNRWICVNPTTSVIDEPNGIETLIRDPISYVLAIDNQRGIRDVTSRYASDYVKPHFRRRRCDKPWLIRTLRKKSLAANAERAQLEDVHFRTELVMRPLPTSLLEFKNHPLYVLEKDLLKFQALYPPIDKQKPIGNVKGHDVYPRDTVYFLQNEKRWEKMARSIKKNEEPYKIVKAITDPRIPVEEREQLFVGIYGYWQTCPFQPPAVKNGRIPRNEFGNVYIYQPSMTPIGTVHLRLNGLPNIARKLNKECAPAVVGWDFHSCSNYPIVEGACVLEKDAELFVEEWTRQEEIRKEKEAKKEREHNYENWRKLIKGVLRLHYVKNRFGAVDKPVSTKGSKGKGLAGNVDETPAEPTIIDRTKQASKLEFSLDRLPKF